MHFKDNNPHFKILVLFLKLFDHNIPYLVNIIFFSKFITPETVKTCNKTDVFENKQKLCKHRRKVF